MTSNTYIQSITLRYTPRFTCGGHLRSWMASRKCYFALRVVYKHRVYTICTIVCRMLYAVAIQRQH